MNRDEVISKLDAAIKWADASPGRINVEISTEAAKFLRASLTPASSAELVEKVRAKVRDILCEGYQAGSSDIAVAEYSDEILALIQPQPVGDVREAFESAVESAGINYVTSGDYEALRELFQAGATYQATQQAAGSEQKDWLKILEDQCWDLRCVEEPGDDDVHWEIVGHWMAEPQQRVIGFGNTPIAAIQDALRPRDYDGDLLPQPPAQGE